MPKSKLVHRFLPIFVALCFLAACQTGINSESDKLTWTMSFYSLPDNLRINFPCKNNFMKAAGMRKRCFSAMEGKAKIPAVIFLHGCGGLGGNSIDAMNLFSNAGYSVFAPNSFARPGRARSCGRVRGVMHFRDAEIRQALFELKKFSWIDQSKLVLAGFSEGGIAAAEFGGSAFKARVILGWGCSRGIAASSDVPVLNLVGERDDQSSTGNDLCSVSGRPKSLARHTNSGHAVANDPNAVNIVRKFMQDVLN